MRLLVPLAVVLLLAAARNLPQHKAHKRHLNREDVAEQNALRALQDEELRAWEEDQRVRRQLGAADMAAEEKMRLAEEHWQRNPINRRRGGCRGRNRPTNEPIRRRCPPRGRNPHDRVLNGNGDYSANNQFPNSGYPYPITQYENTLDTAAYEAERAEYAARLKIIEAERAAVEAERAAYEERYRLAELKRAEEEEKYRLALEERRREDELFARNREEEERRYNELNEQRQREYEEGLRRHREQYENESSRRRAPCPALRHDVLDGKTYEQIFLFAHKSGCSESETRMAIDMARQQRSEQFVLKYKFPVLFFSRTRGWVKIHTEAERVRFEEQEADLDFERLRAQYQFVKEIETHRPRPHHPPAYTEEELEHSRRLAEAEEKDKEGNYDVIDKDNNQAVAYSDGEAEKKDNEVIDAIVLPQDEDETEAEEEKPVPAPFKEELEEELREKEAAENDKDELSEIVDKVREELDKEVEEKRQLEEEEEERLKQDAERLEKERLVKERLVKERLVKEEEERELKEAMEKVRAEKEELEKEIAEGVKEEMEAQKNVEKELPDEEAAVEEKKEEEKKEEVKEEDNKEVEVEDAAAVIPDIGEEIVPEAAEKVDEKTEEKKEEEVKEEEKKEEETKEVEKETVVVEEPVKEPEAAAVAAPVEPKQKPAGQALAYDPNESLD